MSVSDEHDEDEEPSNRSTPSTQPESQPQPQPQSDACSSTSISISISRSPSVEEKTMDQPPFVQPQVLAKSVPTVQPLDVSSVFDPSSLLSITPVTASTPMASIQPRSLISRHSSVMAFDPFSVGRRQSLLSPADTLSGHIWPTLHQPSFAPKVGSGHSVYGNTVPHYHSTLAQNANSAAMLDRQPLQHQQLPRSSSISTSPMVSNVSGQQNRQLAHSSSDYIVLEDILKVSQEERDRTVAGMMSAISSGVPLSSLATKVHAELIRLDKQLENVLRSTSKSNEMIERICLRV
ncbi:hypothetical protein GQ42DRAFT_157808 [Ramicandelaber brevisporus]|nr:hypothetical protein GQ42DRAFT_157808 [Ramicandelaber brevisporus]